MAIIYDGSLDKEVYKNVFGKTIEEIADNDSKVVYLDADLMNSFGTLNFWKRNKKQAFNCGIGEANMIGVAAGLAAAGKKPYVHTFGPFATRRCYDQLFLSVAYAGNSVRVFGTDPGVTAGFNGGTHMPFEDVAIIRAIPHSTVIEISDGAMLKRIIADIKDKEGLTYVRTTRKAYPTMYSEDHDFQIGKGEVLVEGTDVTIIACGLMVGEAMKAETELKKQGVSVRVIDMFTIKPIDSELVIESAKKTGAIVTAENHNIIGGLGDAVSDVLIKENCLVPMKKVGVEDEFGSVGSQDYLQDYYGLTAEEIIKAVNEVLEK
jgi:transketolase